MVHRKLKLLLYIQKQNGCAVCAQISLHWRENVFRPILTLHRLFVAVALTGRGDKIPFA